MPNLFTKKILAPEKQILAFPDHYVTLPAVIKYETSLAGSINAIKATGVDACTGVQGELLAKVSKLAASLNENIGLLEKAVEKADNFTGDIYDLGMMYRYEVFEEMNKLRAVADELETIVDKEFWPLPTYEDMLFHV